jgi:hypothetical protein
MNRFLPIFPALVLLGATPARAAEPAPLTPADSVLQQELKQQQLKTTTRKVGEQLEAIVTEFDRNGIQGEDVKVLRAIRSVLDRLSQQDMEKVITFLQQTRAAGDPAASARHATEAFAGQKTIIVQLQQLVLEYQRQQALYEMSLRLKELANRQTANMWLGVSLAKSTDGKAGFHTFDENQKISLRYQQSEQNPLKDEVAAILKKLEKLSAEIADGPTAERPKAALQQAWEGGLTPALEAAATELQENGLKLLSAIGNEKKARDQMREIARLLLLSQDAIDALKQALQELDRAMDAQKKVTAETQSSKKKDEAERRAAEQAAVVDDTDLIRRDIDSLAPIASEHLKGAVAKMQDARESLEKQDEVKRRVEKAQPRQQEALAEMQQARHALEEQLAKAEELAEKPENALAALRELQKEVRELIKNEDAHRQETATADKQELASKAPRQGELKDKAQDLQSRAATPSPEAASALGEAANQMQKAQNTLAQQQNNPAAQQAALDALQKADEALGKDLARLEQAEKDLAKLEELSKRLAEVIQDQQKVQGATAKQAVKPQPEPQPTQELSQKQDKLGQETGALKQEAESPAPEAAPHLDAAQKQMADAKSQLDKPAAREAQPPQKQALNELYQAKNKLDKKIDELRDQLGLPPQSNDNLAQAQKAIEQAQQDVNNALSELQQAPPGLMDALQKQQQEIASSLHELRQDSPQAKPLAQAQQAANDAAQQLGQSNLPKAIESMKAAQNAMQQAKQSGQPPGQESTGQPNGKKGQSPSLSDVSQQQAEVQKAAEALASAQKSTPQASMESAAEALQNAANGVGPLAAGALGQLPFGAQQSLQSAEGSSSEGSAQASGGQSTPAQMSAQAAANALAQAQAALSLAQAGLGSEGAGQQPGQGQGQAQGQGKGKGKGQGKGQGQGQGKGEGQPSPEGNGNDGNWAGSGGANGERRAAAGSGTFTRLPGRDRAAILQSQAEKYPQEYGPLVEQYLRNLSDQGSQK